MKKRRRKDTLDKILQGLRELRARNILTKAELTQTNFLLSKTLFTDTTITPEEVYSAWKLLSKYPKQLSAAGIDFFSIPEPEITPKEVDEYRGTISIYGQRIVLKFDYDYFLIQIIKKFQGSKYNAEKKTWSIPINTRTKHFIYTLAKKDHFYFSPALKPIIEEIEAKYKALEGEEKGKPDELIEAIENFLDHENDDMPIYMEYKKRLLEVLERMKE